MSTWDEAKKVVRDFGRDIRRDFKADCDKYGKRPIYTLVIFTVVSPVVVIAITFLGEQISAVAERPVEAFVRIWIVAAESVPFTLRGPCYFGSVVLMLAVGFVTPLACEGVEIAGRRRLTVVLKLSLALCGAIIVYGAFAVAVLCIDASEGVPRLWILCQAVLAFAAVLYGVVRVSSVPLFDGE